MIINNIFCPKCKSKEIEILHNEENMKDKEVRFARCLDCSKNMFVPRKSFRIIKTEKDENIYFDNFKEDVNKKDRIIDVEGQKFLWEDLEPNGVKLY